MGDLLPAQIGEPAIQRPSRTFGATLDRSLQPPRVSATADFARLGLFCGIIAGLGEISARAIQRAFDSSLVAEDVRTNIHVLWMTPVADAIAGLALALTFAVLTITLRRGRPVCVGILLFLAALAPIWSVRGLHWAARVALAAGIAIRLGTIARRHSAASRQFVRRGLMPLILLLAPLGIVHGLYVARAESRRLAAIPAAKPASPNVLLVVLDTVRADALSIYGADRDTTPNLRRWTQRGVRFEQARATAPWTLPTHASLFTGRWPHELSVSISHALDDTFPTLAETLAERGYATAGFVGNYFYGNACYGLDRGFAHYEDTPNRDAITAVEVFRSAALIRALLDSAWDAGWHIPGVQVPHRAASEINARALAWIDRQKTGNRPFFVFLNYFDAHGPYELPPGAARRFGSDPTKLAEAERSVRAQQKSLRAQHRRRDAPDDGTSEFAGESLAQLNSTTARLTELRKAAYDDCIVYLDAQLGRLFDELSLRGALENTVVVITADHGEHFGERGLLGHGNSLYRPLVHVPLLIFGPGVPTGISVPRPVSVRDVPRTILDVATHSKSNLGGESLRDQWEAAASGKPSAERVALCEVEQQLKLKPSPQIPASNGPMWSVVTSDWTYIRHGIGREELFDLRRDPAEANDLAASPEFAPVLLNFRKALDRSITRNARTSVHNSRK